MTRYIGSHPCYGHASTTFANILWYNPNNPNVILYYLASTTPMVDTSLTLFMYWVWFQLLWKMAVRFRPILHALITRHVCEEQCIESHMKNSLTMTLWKQIVHHIQHNFLFSKGKHGNLNPRNLDPSQNLWCLFQKDTGKFCISTYV